MSRGNEHACMFPAGDECTDGEAEESRSPCSKDRGLRQPGDLTRENNPAIALDDGGARDGSRVCPGDFEAVTVSGSGLEFMAMGSRSVVFAVGVCSASETGVRERDQL